MHSTGPEEKQSSRNERYIVRALAPLFLYFVSAGVVTVMLGPLLPAFIHRWQIRDAQAGTLFLASFLGQLCGSWIAARNLKASVVYGAALTAAGCFALARLDFTPAHIACFVIGLGLGAGITAGNIIAGTILPSSRARLLSLLNVSWSIGAIACPLLIRFTALAGTGRFLSIASACLALSSLALIAVPSSFGSTTSPEARPLARPGLGLHQSALPLRGRSLLVFSAAMFLYIGIENALGGWLPSYALRLHATLHPSTVSLLFWTAELTGRLLVVALLSALTEAALYRLSLASLLCIQVLLCTAPHPSAFSIALLTSLAALSLAPVYPLILSFLLARTGNHARLGIFFAAASCGGAILPWLTGVLSSRFNGLRAGLVVPAIAACLLLAVATTVTARQPAKIERKS